MNLLTLPLYLLFGVLQALVLVHVAYLWLPALVRLALHGRLQAMLRADAGRPGPPTTELVVLIPAHNEAEVIGALLGSLRAQTYPGDRFAVHVVSDNSTDATADVVRAAGYVAHERVTAEPSTKARALAWLWDRLVAEGRVPETAVVVVLDADSTVAPDFLAELDRALATGADVVQAARTAEIEGVSPLAALEAVNEQIRELYWGGARRALGLSSYLRGSGMAFRRAIFHELMQFEAPSRTLTEDAVWQYWLARHHIRVLWWPAARLTAEAVPNLREFGKQRRRWVGDRIRASSRRGWPLLLQGIRRGSLSQIDQALNVLHLPRSVVVLLTLAAAAAAAVWPRAAVLPWWGWLALVAGFGLYLLSGLMTLRPAARVYRSLLLLPLVVAQIALIGLLAPLQRRQPRWEAVEHGRSARHLQPGVGHE